MDKNDKYFALTPNEPIPNSEDISYEMLVNKKSYTASFYYNPLYEMSEEEKIQFVQDLKDSLLSQEGVDSADQESFEQALKLLAVSKLITKANGEVWFTISEYLGKYYISMYYDNLNNRPNGEDL